jgi:chromosomal replication initiator protein
MTNSSFPEIGEKFGGKDHSTVIYAVRQIEKRLSEDRDLKNTIETLKNQLQK